MQEIEKLRSEIDQIHLEMAALFRRRLQITEKIWEIKKSQDLPFFDAAREDAIIHQFDGQVSDPVEQKVLQNFLKSVLNENKKYLEMKLK
jgi:chorismate mutase